jgi:rSAM/selenodomain-associated transferase 2
MASPIISIVIPVLNEAERISETIEMARESRDVEVIVADGGSTDDSPDLARRAGATVITAPRGRAAQMNAGAAAASGDVLLFLHADTRLPKNLSQSVTTALRDPRVVGGCFRLAFDRRGPLLRFFEWCSRFESYFTTFGDQAYFVRRQIFWELGGYPLLPLMEDVALRRQLRRRGRFLKLRNVVVTSARRFAARGVLRQQALNAMLLIGFAFGVPAARLKQLYD